jgi:hypothetical protein
MRLANWITIATPRNEANEPTAMYARNPKALAAKHPSTIFRASNRPSNAPDNGDAAIARKSAIVRPSPTRVGESPTIRVR